MTRVRVLTPAGTAAVAVISLEGSPEADVELHDASGRALAWPQAGSFRRARLRLGGRDVDDVLVVGTAGGAELHVHGGPGILQAVLEGLDPGRVSGATETDPDAPDAVEAPRPESGESVPVGLRAARARASVLHGTLRQLKVAIEQGPVGPELLAAVHRVRANAILARRLETVATVRIVGLPNAGKSTLLNALLMEDRALVSPTAGTTRDAVSAITMLHGVAVRLEDTEGGAVHEISRPGADLLVHLQARSGETTPGALPDGVAVLRVLGKADRDPSTVAVGVSGTTGLGVDALRARIVAALGATGGVADDVLAPVDGELRSVLRTAIRKRPG